MNKYENLPLNLSSLRLRMMAHYYYRSIAADRFGMTDLHSVDCHLGRIDNNLNDIDAVAGFDHRNGASAADKHQSSDLIRHNCFAANAFLMMIVVRFRSYSHHNQVTVAASLTAADIANLNH